MSRMLSVAIGLAVVIALGFGQLYALPNATSTPEGGGKAVAFDKALADKGKQVAAANGCNSCHSINGAKGVGPSWKGTFGTQADIGGGKKVPVDAAFIERAILDPAAEVRSGYGPSMPSFEGKFSAEDIKAVVEYIKSLSG